MTLALIDGDIVCYRCAASAENDPLDIALYRVDDLMRRILHETNAFTYKVFLSGKDNFRYKLYPEYKANRKDKPSPVWRDACKEHIVKQWNAVTVDGREADDELGIEQVAAGDTSIICTIDKDLLQIPGWHYNFVKSERRFVSPFDGLRAFYKQLITGDASDNIPAFDFKFRHSVPKFVQKLLDPIDEMHEEVDMYKYVCSVYEDAFANPLGWKHLEKIIHRNAKLLYIWKKENDEWVEPGREETSQTTENGLMEGIEPSLSQP